MQRKYRQKRRRWPLYVLAVLCMALTVPSAYRVFQEQAQRGEAAKLAGLVSESIVQADPQQIPDYSGEDVIVLNGNSPSFTAEDLAGFTREYYSSLDILGRCGTAAALLHRSMMPLQERGEIGNVRPSGWEQKKYPGIVDADPPYLYNRCHLIAYAFTGQNDNEKNLITGTRYMNAAVMFSWEEQVIHYLYRTGNHVLYRVTPYFKGMELLARGVEMEAYSVEDGGSGICFHVFVYNVQPGVVLDYMTGISHAARENPE